MPSSTAAIALSISRSRSARGTSRLPHAAPRHVAARELGVAVAHVAVFAEHVADEILEVAGEMQGEIAAGVRDAGRNFPQVGVARVGFDLTAQRFELAGDDVGQPVFHQTLPTRMASGPSAIRCSCGAPHARLSSRSSPSTGSCWCCLMNARVADHVITRELKALRREIE